MLILAFSLLTVFLISIASAVEIKLNKETYAPQETLQAEIYGNFIDGLSLKNIYFYRERNLPVIYDILKTKDKYLLYALLPYIEGNYTLKIKNTRYETDTGTSTADIIKEFKIASTNVTTLSINPGFIVTREDFYVKVKANKNINIDVEFLGKKQNLSLVQGIEKKIDFSVSEVKNYTETNLKIQSYIIPVFIFPEKSPEEIIKETGSFRFNPLEISATILKGENYFFKVSLINFGNKNISNINLFSNVSSNLEIKINPNSISKLEAREEKSININFSSEKKGNYSGSIVASSGNLSTELKINMEITEDKSKIKYTGPAYEEKSCADIGKVCNITEKCSGTSVFTKDGYCCQGNCLIEKKSSSWIYGLILIIVVVAGLILLSFYMKKKQRKSVDILKEREKKYEERMAGEEVRGSLAKT